MQQRKNEYINIWIKRKDHTFENKEIRKKQKNIKEILKKLNDETKFEEEVIRLD